MVVFHLVGKGHSVTDIGGIFSNLAGRRGRLAKTAKAAEATKASECTGNLASGFDIFGVVTLVCHQIFNLVDRFITVFVITCLESMSLRCCERDQQKAHKNNSDHYPKPLSL